MATNDWKSELKRRIKDIKERKQQERELDNKIDRYKEKTSPPAEKSAGPKLKVHTPDTADIEKTKPVPNQPEPEQTPPEDAAEEKPEEPVKATKTEHAEEPDEADALFQIEGEASEKGQPQSDKEAAIVEELKRVSGGKRRKKAADEPTLFTVEENQQSNEEDPPVATKSGKTVEPETVSAQAEPEKAQDNLDDALDRYVPIVKEGDDEPLIVEDSPAIEKHHPATVIENKDRNKLFIHRLEAGLTDAGLLLGIEALVVWISSMILQFDIIKLLLNSTLWFAGFFMLLHFVYYVLFTASTGQTLGKSIFRLKVVKKKPGTVGIYKAAARWFLALVSWAAAGLGYLVIFVTRDGRALPDIVLGMNVHHIRKKKKAAKP